MKPRPRDLKPDHAEVAELKNKMQAVLFSIEEGIAMTDFDGNVLLLNDGAKRLLGINKNYPYDRKFLDYVPDDKLKGELNVLLESAKENASRELVIRGNPSEVYVVATKNTVTTARGEALGRVLVLRDITLEKQLEKLKDDFVHSITHDLKSPLTSLQGFLQLFLNGGTGALNKQQRYYIEVMEKSTDKVLRLINNILDMVKVEAGTMRLSREDWDAAAAVRHTIEIFQGMVKQNKVRLFCTIVPHSGHKLSFDSDAVGPAEDWPVIRVQADPTLMERVLVNLVDNAIKFTPGGGEVELRLAEGKDKLTFTVRDTGAGIPKHSLKEVFEKFKQVPGTKGGTGLGLTITRHIIEMHGGKITADSELGKGTTFDFWLPRKR